MKLSKLLKNHAKNADITSVGDPDCSSMTLDSRQVKPGSVFLAYPGHDVDGRQFIEDAIRNGAIAVTYDPADDFLPTEAQARAAAFVPVEQLAQKVSDIAGVFYQHPSQKTYNIGVTGTNGKTSCMYFIAQCLERQGLRNAVMGTIGAGQIQNLAYTGMTTPDPIATQALFARWRSAQVDYVTMEVSSHALAQHRVEAVHYDIAVFTQLTQDHLDYHGDMESYAAAKQKLFERPELQHAVLNWDDAIGRRFAELPNLSGKVILYSVEPSSERPDIPAVVATAVERLYHGFKVTIESPWGDATFTTGLLGDFNVANLLAVVACLGAMGLPLNKIVQLVSQIKPVRGRMHWLENRKAASPKVIVDFAHTPDALDKALYAVKSHCRGKLICLFGCGGDRDQKKRPLMAKAAETYSDKIILTNDNPRTENAETIVQQIQAGFSQKANVHIEYDRAKAIKLAIDCASDQDMVLLAGKGHETVQWLSTGAVPHDDIAIAQSILNQL